MYLGESKERQAEQHEDSWRWNKHRVHSAALAVAADNAFRIASFGFEHFAMPEDVSHRPPALQWRPLLVSLCTKATTEFVGRSG